MTRNDLREMLSYDADTGIFTWRVSRSRTLRGTIAGYLERNGYLRIRIRGRQYLAHRLAWLWFYGRWPTNQIDHLNGKRDDNRIANLREATPSQNAQNARRRSDSGSPYKGVTFCGGKWRAQIGIVGQSRFLGLFDTPEDAHKRYCEAAQVAYGPFWRAE